MKRMLSPTPFEVFGRPRDSVPRRNKKPLPITDPNAHLIDAHDPRLAHMAEVEQREASLTPVTRSPESGAFGACDMAEVIQGKFGIRRRSGRGWAKYEAQESEEGGDRDIKRPPDEERPDLGEEMTDPPNGPGSPPFTGEDVEDVGRPRKKDNPRPM